MTLLEEMQAQGIAPNAQVTIKAGWGAQVEIFGQFNDYHRFSQETPAEVERILPNCDVILFTTIRGKRARVKTKPHAILN